MAIASQFVKGDGGSERKNELGFTELFSSQIGTYVTTNGEIMRITMEEMSKQKTPE